MRVLHAMALTAGLCVAVTRAAAAQADDPGARGDKVRSCEKAVKTVENGRPAHKEAAALSYLQLCGKAGASAMARAVAGARTETDLSALNELRWSLNDWRDAVVMEAAMAVARDANASVPARVSAVRYLLYLPRRAHYAYADLIAGTRVVTEADGSQTIVSGCRLTAIDSEPAKAFGTALPADYRERLRAFLAALAADGTAPPEVRNAAQCGTVGS